MALYTHIGTQDGTLLIQWITNPDGTLHTQDTQDGSRWIQKLDPETCRQQWPHEDHWDMPNPLEGYDDPYYHNHDLDVNADIDEEWFQGRDGWD